MCRITDIAADCKRNCRPANPHACCVAQIGRRIRMGVEVDIASGPLAKTAFRALPTYPQVVVWIVFSAQKWMTTARKRPQLRLKYTLFGPRVHDERCARCSTRPRPRPD